jgi:hypothetical protein
VQREIRLQRFTSGVRFRAVCQLELPLTNQPQASSHGVRSVLEDRVPKYQKLTVAALWLCRSPLDLHRRRLACRVFRCASRSKCSFKRCVDLPHLRASFRALARPRHSSRCTPLLGFVRFTPSRRHTVDRPLPGSAL